MISAFPSCITAISAPWSDKFPKSSSFFPHIHLFHSIPSFNIWQPFFINLLASQYEYNFKVSFRRTVKWHQRCQSWRLKLQLLLLERTTITTIHQSISLAKILIEGSDLVFMRMSEHISKFISLQWFVHFEHLCYSAKELNLN